MAEAERTEFWRRHAVRLAGLALAMVAALGVIFAFRLGEGMWYGRLVEEVSFAFLVAALLGLSIDYLLKQDLVADSFKAAIGYLLPDELRPELAWIHGMAFLATCEIDLEIHRMADDPQHVVVRERVTRHFKNITKSRQQIHPAVGLDEWFYPGRPSNVERFTWTVADRRFDLADMKANRERRDATFGIAREQQWIGPGETCAMTAELVQVRGVSDQAFDFFGSPTTHTRIAIRIDEDLAYSVAPQHREAAHDLGNGVFELDKTLLPGQVIRVRWWEKKAMEEWISAFLPSKG